VGFRTGLAVSEKSILPYRESNPGPSILKRVAVNMCFFGGEGTLPFLQTTGKVKITLEQAMKAQKGRKGIARLALTSVLDVRGWLTPRPDRFTSRRGPVPIVQEAGWATTRSESLYRLSYRGPQRLQNL
jgi:hypothetical protein